VIDGDHKDRLERIESAIVQWMDWYTRVEIKINKLLQLEATLVAFESSVQAKLDDLNTKVDALMAVADDIKAAIANLDTETTAVAANIAAIAAKIKNSMTDAEVADIQTAFGLLSDRLVGLAQDPTAPVPAPAPALASLRKKL